VTDRLSSLALREIRAEFSKKPVLFAVFGVGLILGLSGPFGTIDAMNTMVRIAYWVAIAVGTYAIGVGVGASLTRLLHHKSRVFRIAVSSIVTGLVISLFLLAFNWAFVGRIPISFWDICRFLAEVILITSIINIGIDLARADGADKVVETGGAPILERLPIEKRGALVCLSVSDHYVDVSTNKGQEMILMRLTDAIKEVGAIEGLQVHRSHWVALDQVKSVERAGDGATLSMTTGQIIPVSRSKMPDIREAGLLPKR